MRALTGEPSGTLQQRRRVNRLTVRSSVNNGRKLYDRLQDAVIFSPSPYADDQVAPIASSYFRMLDLLIRDAREAQSTTELLDRLKDLVDWVADAPVSFELRLCQLGIRVDRERTKVGFRPDDNYRPSWSSAESAAPFSIPGRKGGQTPWTLSVTATLYVLWN